MPDIIVRDAEVRFPGAGRGADSVLALADVNIEIPDQQFVSLLGPSGCGKSTLLNLISGFLKPTSGEVLVSGRRVEAPGPDRGVVFQDANVFPWLTCAENVAFGPSLRRQKPADYRDQVDHYLDRVGLLPFRDRLPMDLSGGMRQRLSLARVLINDPPILLMDEPFGALDAQTRIIMQELLLELWERDRKTVVFVTHDIDEALLLADRVYVMTTRPGRILDHVDVPLPRPRSYQATNEPVFRDLRLRLFEQLHEDAAHSATRTVA